MIGSKLAVERLRARKDGGALINVGSILSDMAVPVQGPYSASKHAVKGFTNALRMELLKDAPGVQVTLIKPSAIDTPYKEHARNYTANPGTNPPPVYATPLVAEAILHAAEHRTREITVGGGGRLQAIFGQLFPAISEPLGARMIPPLMKDKTANHPADSDALHAAGRDLRERAPYPMVREVSWYSQAQMKPNLTAARRGDRRRRAVGLEPDAARPARPPHPPRDDPATGGRLSAASAATDHGQGRTLRAELTAPASTTDSR